MSEEGHANCVVVRGRIVCAALGPDTTPLGPELAPDWLGWLASQPPDPPLFSLKLPSLTPTLPAFCADTHSHTRTTLAPTMKAKLIHLLQNEYFKLYSLSQTSFIPAGFIPPGTLLNKHRVSISSSELYQPFGAFNLGAI